MKLLCHGDGEYLLSKCNIIGISMYIQLTMEDTKAFRELQNHQKSIGSNENREIKKSPVLEALIKYPKRIALAGAFLSIQVTFYILVAFLLAYGNAQVTDMSRDDMLSAVLIGSAIMVPVQFMFSSYSDRNGRKGIFMTGAILTAIWAFAIFPLVDTGNFWLIVLAVTFGLSFLAMMYGPQAAFFTEYSQLKLDIQELLLVISSEQLQVEHLLQPLQQSFGQILIFFGYLFI